MSRYAHDLKSYYSERQGRLVRRILLSNILKFWPNTKGLEIVGFGYATPYLRVLGEGAQRAFALMPAGMGAHRWPDAARGGNLVALADEGQWPLAAESVDRLLIIHSLEHADDAQTLLAEAHRVLKSNGSLLIIFPRRLGLWARVDWNPFGHGTPYTTNQITKLLQETGFLRERAEHALFMPPFRSFALLRMAYTLEAFGKFLFPGLAGVGIVEASKQIYVGNLVASRSGAQYRKRVIRIPAPAPRKALR